MQAELQQLISRKDEIQLQIQHLNTEIQLIDQVRSFSKGLTDAEGFPRADIDFGQLANYRTLKRRKAQLNNDHLALMKQIENKLFAYHATLPKIGSNQSSQTLQSKQTKISFKKKEETPQITQEKKVSPKIDYLTPFAIIALVFEHSPAEIAGLKVGDLVSQFADITIYSMDWLKQIAETVREGVSLKVVVLRMTIEQQNETKKQVFRLKDGNWYQKLQFSLLPSQWEGKGLLGCKIDPIK